MFSKKLTFQEPLHDIVINGHPKFIPYALLALKNAWKDLYTLDVKTFTHATVSDIGTEAKDFEQALKTVPVNTNNPKINITLIWKNCKLIEFKCTKNDIRTKGRNFR